MRGRGGTAAAAAIAGEVASGRCGPRCTAFAVVKGGKGRDEVTAAEGADEAASTVVEGVDEDASTGAEDVEVASTAAEGVGEVASTAAKGVDEVASPSIEGVAKAGPRLPRAWP